MDVDTNDDIQYEDPTTGMITHDSDHSRLMAEVANLRPDAKAVLVLIEPPEGDEGEKYIVQSYGVDSEWYAIMGVLATGQAYCASTMFATETGSEDVEPYPHEEDDDEAGEAE